MSLTPPRAPIWSLFIQSILILTAQGDHVLSYLIASFTPRWRSAQGDHALNMMT